MKSLQQKFKIFIVLFFIGFMVASCGSDKKSDKEKTNANDEQSQQVDDSPAKENNSNLTSPKSQQDEKSQIAQDEEGTTSPDFSEANTAAILLDCNYFREHPNAVLKNNPEATTDYIITCMARIEGKLTIEAGVHIAFDQDAGLEFKNKSSFKMQGTAEKPIVLTGKEQTKGFWRGIRTESPSANNKMSYVTVDYAGSSKAALEVSSEKSSLRLDHCTFSNSKNTGMLVNDDVGKDVHNIMLSNCTFTKNNIPVKTNITRLRMFNGSNSFSGNEKDYISLERERLHGDATWAKLDVPYFLQDNFRYGDGVLTVEPGTKIIISAQNWMHLSKKASLVMVGTAEDPIIIRGEHDVPGFWDGLTINSSSPLNKIAYVNFKNAGKTTGKPNGAVKFRRSKFLKIHDVVFTKCFAYGVSIQDAGRSHLDYANLTLENTPKLFSDWSGKEISDPENL